MAKRSKTNSVLNHTTAAVRTGEGLRDALFDEIDKLRNGTGNPTHAIAVAKLACQIINIVKIETEYQRHIQAMRSLEGGPISTETIKLGTARV